jgi:uncharacterized membrane protein
MKILFKIADVMATIMVCFWYVILGFKMYNFFIYGPLALALVASVIIFGFWYITRIIRGVRDISIELKRNKQLSKENLIKYDFFKNKSIPNQNRPRINDRS